MQLYDLSSQQLANLNTLERSGSALSLVGTLLIVATFLGSKSFHKPISRLIFYASVGNMACNAGTLISRAAVASKSYNGALCQTQAFLIQMFMPADVFWAFSMALNVYLTFYCRFNAADLRRLEIYYLGACYGLPFIPAFVYLFVTDQEEGRVYGDATLWCWITARRDTLRMATFYGPIWLVILASFAIYVRAGKDIWIKRKQLQDANISPPDRLEILSDPFRSQPVGHVMVCHTVTTTSALFVNTENIVYPQVPGQAAQKFGAEYLIEIQANQPTEEKDIRSPYITPVRRYAAIEANRAIWSYTKVSALFFLAMMVTWLPSSANRVYSVVYPGQIQLVLQYLAAFVLPLQGLWNALIYAIASQQAFRDNWKRFQQEKGVCETGIRGIYRRCRMPQSKSEFLHESNDSGTELQSPATIR